MSRPNEFVYQVKTYTYVKWYVDKDGDVMASNATITEHVPVFGPPPTGFARFVGQGSMDVETVLGEKPVGYHIPIHGAKNIQGAIEMLDEADKAIQPTVVIQAKEQAKQKYDEIHSQVVRVGSMPSQLGGPGSSGLVLP